MSLVCVKDGLNLDIGKTSLNHTIWYVSNCDNTNGARARWDYAQSLIQVGLKLDG